MDTFELLMQIFFGWTLIIVNIIVLVILYNRNKHKGWLYLLISSSINLLNKVIASAASFWIRERVSLADLSSFGSAIGLVNTFLSIAVYGLSAYGLFLILKELSPSQKSEPTQTETPVQASPPEQSQAQTTYQPPVQQQVKQPSVGTGSSAL